MKYVRIVASKNNILGDNISSKINFQFFNNGRFYLKNNEHTTLSLAY